MTFLGDVVARARGLARHLLDPAALERLAAHRSGLAAALAERGYPVAATERGAAAGATAALDLAIARGAQRRLALLARWLGRRQRLFAAVLEEEERNTLRMLLRSVAAGERTAPELALLPTPALPQRTLASLALAADPAELVARLDRLGSPYAAPLADALRKPDGDLLALERALDRTFAARACEGARRGGAPLRTWVAESLDLANAWDALLGDGAAFLEGGRWLSRARHASIARAADAPARWRLLGAAFAPSPVAGLFAGGPASLPELERRALAERIAALRRLSRREPLGAAPILEVMLRVRAEASDLRHLCWGIAQGVPPHDLRDELAGLRP